MTAATFSYDMLRKIPIFSGLSENEAKQLAAIADEVEFAPSQFVFEQGTTSQKLWILLEGKCEVSYRRPNGKPPGKPILLVTLEPYSNFGEMSFFHSVP